MLFELVLPRVATTAAFPPVQGEILELLQREIPGHVVEALQQLKHVLAGGEIGG
jgi:hypothetical protein